MFIWSFFIDYFYFKYNTQVFLEDVLYFHFLFRLPGDNLFCSPVGLHMNTLGLKNNFEIKFTHHKIHLFEVYSSTAEIITTL